MFAPPELERSSSDSRAGIERAAEVAGHARRREHVVEHRRDQRDERGDTRDEAKPVGRGARHVALVEREKQRSARGLKQRDETDRPQAYDERIGGQEHER